MVDTADLSPDAATHEGSSPSAPTNQQFKFYEGNPNFNWILDVTAPGGYGGIFPSGYDERGAREAHEENMALNSKGSSR